MCLRMGEDTQATISLSLNSLSSAPSFFFFFPIISLRWCSWVSHTIITGSISQQPSFFFQPLVCSLCAPFSYLFNLLPGVSFPSPSRSLSLSLLLSYWEAAMLSYNLDKAGCYACTCWHVRCVSVCLFLRDRCKDLALIQTAAHVGPANRGEEKKKKKRQCGPGKTKLNTFLWNIAATGAEIT